MFFIRAETPADAPGVDSLNDAGFGPDRLQRTVWTLRRGAMAAGLAHVAADPENGRLLATLRFWPVRIGEATQAVLLGPLAVCPNLRGQGIGRALVAHGLQAARDEGWDLCLVSGEPDYYRPFGFEPADAFGIEVPGPLRAGWLQVRELRTGALDPLRGADRLTVSVAAERPAVQPRRGHRCDSINDRRRRTAMG